jgi:HD-like signal output (HDOD) protein/CRP-like cAMP-binding protein
MSVKVIGFETLSKADRSAVFSVGTTKRFKTDDFLMREGESDSSFYLIVEGTVGIYKSVANEGILVDTLKTGDWVGEIAMVAHVERVASAVALSPVAVLAFTQDSYAMLPEKLQLHFNKAFLELASRRLGGLQRKTAEAGNKLVRLGAYVEKMRGRVDDCMDTDLVRDIIHRIPKLPPYASGLASKIVDERASVAEAAEAIKVDPALTAIVLKTVNSAYYGFQEKISDIYRAYLLLGANQVYNIVMDEGFRSVMPKSPEFVDLQKHSLMVSTMAYEVSVLAGHKASSSVNGTIGLLHDIGASVILLLKRQNPRIGPLIDLLTPTRLGAHLLKSWDLPEKLCATVRMQELPEYERPEKIPENIRANIAVLHIAQCCAERLMPSTDAKAKADAGDKEIYFDDYAEYLGLNVNGCEEFLVSRLLPAMHKNLNTYQKWLQDLITARMGA